MWFSTLLVSQHFLFSQHLVGRGLLRVVWPNLKLLSKLYSPSFGLTDLRFDPFGWSLWLWLTLLQIFLVLNEVVLELLIRWYLLLFLEPYLYCFIDIDYCRSVKYIPLLSIVAFSGRAGRVFWLVFYRLFCVLYLSCL